MSSLLDMFSPTITVLYSISGAKHLAYTLIVIPGLLYPRITLGGRGALSVELLFKLVTLATFIIGIEFEEL